VVRVDVGVRLTSFYSGKTGKLSRFVDGIDLEYYAAYNG